MKHLVLIFTLLATPAFSVQPEEVLDDPLLELRAREISKNLRCLVCRNESIDDSNADVARDLRLLVRERLLLGEGDDEVIDYIVHGVPGEFAGFGEYVLLRPQTTGSNLVLWGAGPVMLILSVLLAGGYLRRRARTPVGQVAGLNDEEKDRLAQILKE